MQKCIAPNAKASLAMRKASSSMIARAMLCGWMIACFVLPTTTLKADYFNKTHLVDGNTFELRQDDESITFGPSCLYVNKKRHHCFDADQAGMGEPIRTKNYVLIVVSSGCSGSACVSRATHVIIMRGSDVRVDGSIVKYCVSCTDKHQIDYDNDVVTFLLDREKGREFAARFEKGSITIASRPISRREPLTDDECEWLHKFMLVCAGIPRRDCKFLSDEDSLKAMGIMFPREIWRLGRSYTGFNSRRIWDECRSSCNGKPRMAWDKFQKAFCLRG